ncbi:MAG: CZB domain-containing protein [Sulfuritalea sp.]|nr:CZB domain-containing protein [Sulfuritalea sp.]
MQAFDFDSAIDMHRSWKMKFHLAIDTIRSKDFDTQPIGDEAGCGLGQWLAANAGELARFRSATELLAIHQEFHRQSESIAAAIKSGKIVRLTDNAIVEFGALSAKIEALLLELKTEIRQAG